MFDEFFARAHELTQKGEAFATATVVRAEKPTSGKPGDKAIITRDGVMVGWVGGSCAQPVVIEEALAALRDGESRFVRITPEPGRDGPQGGIKEVAMTCWSGGTLDVFIEPQEPRPQLLVVGHLPAARALLHLGRAMSYRTVAVLLEPPESNAAPIEADALVTDLEAMAAHVTPDTYVVVATHGHFDEAALERVLRTPAPYVGFVSSRRRAGPVIEHLRRQGFGDGDLRRLKIPAGLDIGARRGDEIALSIMAEIVQLRRSAERLAAAVAETAEVAAEASTLVVEVPETAVDPVCGMTVQVASARHTVALAGTVFYFCCAGCAGKFAADPASFGV